MFKFFTFEVENLWYWKEVTNWTTWKKTKTSLFWIAWCSFSISSRIDCIRTDTQVDYTEIMQWCGTGMGKKQNLNHKRKKNKWLPQYPPDKNWFTKSCSNSKILSFVEGKIPWSQAIFLMRPRETLCGLSRLSREAEVGFPFKTTLEPSCKWQMAAVT